MLSQLKRPAWLLIFSGFTLFAGLEVAIRISGLSPKPSQRSLFTVYDPLYGWKKRPSFKHIYATEEYSTPEEFNSQGLRGPEYSYGKPKNEYRILILGDSHTEGPGVEFEGLFSEHLKRRLNLQSGRPYQVINAGTRGYSTDQEYLFFKNEGRKYHPDLTLVMIYSNDIWQNNQPRRGWNKPLFKLRQNQLELSQVPVPKPDLGWSLGQKVQSECSLCRWVYDQVQRGPLFSWTLKFKLAALQDDLGEWNKNDSAMREAWNITEAILREFQKETEKAGSRFLVVYLPGTIQFDEEIWKAARKKYGLVGDGWDPLQISIQLEAVTSKNNIEFFNLLPGMKKAGKSLGYETKDIFYLKDLHWTAKGHELAGILLSEAILPHAAAERAARGAA